MRFGEQVIWLDAEREQATGVTPLLHVYRNAHLQA